MSDALMITGYAVAIVLLLIPVVLLGRLAFGIAMALRDARRAEARKVVRALPGYGEFANTGGPGWTGHVNGVFVCFDTPQWPPAPELLTRLDETIRDLPRHVATARAFIEASEGAVWTDGAPGPYAVDLSSGPDWALELSTPGDTEHVFRVYFTGNAPTSYGLDG